MSRRRYYYCKKEGRVVEVVLFKPRLNRAPAVHILKPHFNPSLGEMVYSKMDQERKFRAKGLAPTQDYPHCMEGVHKPKLTKPDVKDAVERATARLKEAGEIP